MKMFPGAHCQEKFTSTKRKTKSISRISIMSRKWSNEAFDAILLDEEEIFGDNGVYNILKDETLKK